MLSNTWNSTDKSIKIVPSFTTVSILPKIPLTIAVFLLILLKKVHGLYNLVGHLGFFFTVLTVESFSSFAIYFENCPFIYFVLTTE